MSAKFRVYEQLGLYRYKVNMQCVPALLAHVIGTEYRMWAQLDFCPCTM